MPKGHPFGLLLTNCIFTHQTSALTQGLERIPDQLGYLVLSEGAVLAVRSGNGGGFQVHDSRMPLNVALFGPGLVSVLVFFLVSRLACRIKSINQSLDSQSCNYPEVKEAY